MGIYNMLDKKNFYQITKPIPALPFFLREKGKGSEKCKKIFCVLILTPPSIFPSRKREGGRGDGFPMC